MSGADVLAYRMLIRGRYNPNFPWYLEPDDNLYSDNLAFMNDITPTNKIEFVLYYDHVIWTLEAYFIDPNMHERDTLHESRGCSPGEAYKNMFYQTAVRIDEGDY
ncbi:hypothetical protein KCU65_g3280, partial [Aureobasidium melanogenum]